MELLINEDVYDVPIPLLIRNNNFSFNNRHFIREYHVYTKVWSPLLGECLFGKKEPSNRVYKNAATMICLHSRGRDEVVCHVP